jgi:hypothetical protein
MKEYATSGSRKTYKVAGGETQEGFCKIYQGFGILISGDL